LHYLPFLPVAWRSSAEARLKGGPLANRDDDTIEATMDVANAGVRNVRRDQRLLFGFLAQTGLSI
jgi:hypothetical protein